MKKLQLIVLNKNALSILTDHNLEFINVNDFIHKQQVAATQFKPNNSKHAIVTIAEDLSSGLLFVKKTFGLKNQIPFHVAKELTNDYLTHQARLQELGIKVAPSYEMSLSRIGEFGLITTYQLFFPEGTLAKLMCDSNQTDEILTKQLCQTMQDTLIPVLIHNDRKIKDSESFVFLDSAPNNVAPFMMRDRCVVFYFDLFVPRIRNEDGSVKEYTNFNPHIRSEAEMRKRFFTKAGILQNFLVKGKRDLVGKEHAWNQFLLIVKQELDPHIQKYFPGMSINEIINFKLN